VLGVQSLVGTDSFFIIIYYLLATLAVKTMKSTIFRYFGHVAFTNICCSIFLGILDPFFGLVFIFRLLGYEKIFF